MTDRELLLWLQGYLYDKSDLSIHEIVMLKGKIGAFLDKGDEKVVFDTTPSPRIIYNEDDSTRPRDPQSWELDPFRTTCDYTTGAEPLFPVYHISGCKFTTNEKGHLTWVDPDSKSDSEDSSSRVPVKSETEVALEVANALIETLENEVEVLQERVANLKRHNDFLLESKEKKDGYEIKKDGSLEWKTPTQDEMNIRILNKQKSELEGKLENAKNHIEALRSDNEELSDANANLLHDLESSETQVEILSEKNANLAEVICDLNEKLVKAEKTIFNQRNSIESMETIIEGLEQALHEARWEAMGEDL